MSSLPRIKVVGFDPSMNNWGIAIGSMVLGDISSLVIEQVIVVHPDKDESKKTRQNSKDIAAALELFSNALRYAVDAQAIFVEVPVGSQTARGSVAYGVCIGILGSLRAQGIQFIEVSPNEVKTSTVGDKQATKKQMIEWAFNKHPEANWPYHSSGGKQVLTESKAEHMADAIAAIYAGFKSSPYQQLMQLASSFRTQK